MSGATSTVDATCAGCSGACCHAYRVPVNWTDVQRLCRGLHVPVEKVAGFLAVEPGDRGAIRLDDSGQRHSLHLRRRETDGGCRLLVRLPDGTERCSVYEHRPTLCRTYPASLRGRVALREDHVCPPHLCGFLDTPAETWWAALWQSEAEWTVYDAVTAEWDRRAGPEPATPATCFAWLDAVYEQAGPLLAGFDPVARSEELPQLAERAAAVAAAAT